jgi:hypothetical protein
MVQTCDVSVNPIGQFDIIDLDEVQPLPDLSYDQTLRKRITVQPIIKMSFKMLFRATFLYHVEETQFLSLCIGTTHLKPLRHAAGCIFHVISYFRLTTKCPESILF